MNPHRNKTLRQEYADEHPLDEVAFELGVVLSDNLGFMSMYVGIEIAGTDPNHIWSLGRRPDVRSNLIKLSAAAHRHFHKHSDTGRVLSMLAKAEKSQRTGDVREFDVEELDVAAGRSVYGWTQCAEVPPWVEPYRQRLIEHFKNQFAFGIKEPAHAD